MTERGQRHQRRRLAATCLLVGGAVLATSSACSHHHDHDAFVVGLARRRLGAGLSSQAQDAGRERRTPAARVVPADYVDIWEVAERTDSGETFSLDYFAGSQESLWIAFFLVVVNLPGVVSLVTRTGVANYEVKRLLLPGQQCEGFELRVVAGGICSYFNNRNYVMQPSAKRDRVRFVGAMQGSLSQALYVSLCALGAAAAVGVVLQSLFPAGPLGLGPNWWYSLALLSPSTGLYYWSNAFRDDIAEIQLGANDNETTVYVDVFADKTTIESFQEGIRFESQAGVLYRFAEPGMEFQPGVFDDLDDAIVVRAGGARAAVAS